MPGGCDKQRRIEQLETAIADAVDGFCIDVGWVGGFFSLAKCWFAPPAWNTYTDDGEILAARFALVSVLAADGCDVMAAPRQPSDQSPRRWVLRWEREVAGSSVRFAKFVAKQREMVARLETAGSFRDRHLGAAFHLPIVFDAAQIGEAWSAEEWAGLVEPLAAALRTAHDAAPLFGPVIDWTKDQLQR